MSTSPANRSRRILRADALAPLLGLAAVVVGVGLAWHDLATPRWFAYAPLSGETFAGAATGRMLAVGVVLVAVGLVVIAFWSGWRFARRSDDSATGR